MSDTQPKNDTPVKKRIVPLLVWCTVLSAGLHMTPLLTMLHISWSPDMQGFKSEWVGKFQDLKSIGHGNSGRWAQLSDTLPPREQKEPDALKKELEEEMLKKEPPKAKVEKKPDPPKEKPKKPKKKKKVRKKLKKKPKNKLAVKTKTPKPKKVDNKPKPKDEDEAKQRLAQNTTSKSSQANDLPGLTYGGPSKIPSLRNYAPGNARMTALIRLDRIRNTRLAAPVKKIIESVPDYRILLDGSKVDPIRDFKTLFTASANPRYVQQTFLAIRHNLGRKKAKEALSGRFSDEIPWKRYRGVSTRALVPKTSAYQDPRKLLLVGSKLAVVSRKEWLPQLTSDQPSDAAIRPKTDVATEQDEPVETPKFTMLDGLQRIEKAAEKDATMAIMSLQGLYVMLPGYGRLPAFDAASLTLKNPKNPTLTIDLKMSSEAAAKKLEADCPTLRKKLQTFPVRMLQLGSYIERATCTRQKDYVTVKAKYTQTELLRLLNILAPFVPRPPALEDLPTPPPVEEPPADLKVIIDPNKIKAPDTIKNNAASPPCLDKTKPCPTPTKAKTTPDTPSKPPTDTPGDDEQPKTPPKSTETTKTPPPSTSSTSLPSSSSSTSPKKETATKKGDKKKPAETKKTPESKDKPRDTKEDSTASSKTPEPKPKTPSPSE